MTAYYALPTLGNFDALGVFTVRTGKDKNLSFKKLNSESLFGVINNCIAKFIAIWASDFVRFCFSKVFDFVDEICFHTEYFLGFWLYKGSAFVKYMLQRINKRLRCFVPT